MKLLFDENLSPRLVRLLADTFPGSAHVREVGLLGASDARVWEHAKGRGFGIASKDEDFRQRSFLEGAPPKVVWLQVGNAGTVPIAELLRRAAPHVRTFADEADSAFLILRLPRARR